ncbi:MAG: DUF1328 domain-containing protein [Flavobacteriales bacterium]
MLRRVLTFLIIELEAAAFGFIAIATGAGGVAKLIFAIALVLLLLSCILGPSMWKKAP